MDLTDPQIELISYTRRKPDQDIRLLNWKDIPLCSVVDTQVIFFAPGTVGGNHRHPRTEWYIAFGDLVLYWLDKDGRRHQRKLNTRNELLLVMIPPFLPHAVKNVSKDQFALLLEMADAEQLNVERIKVR